MEARQILDALALAKAEQVHEQVHSILAALSRFDIDSGVDRLFFINGSNGGHMIGLPTRPGVTSTATTGVPTNGVGGFCVGAMFVNFKGASGSALYSNIGSNTSATWQNIV